MFFSWRDGRSCHGRSAARSCLPPLKCGAPPSVVRPRPNRCRIRYFSTAVYQAAGARTSTPGTPGPDAMQRLLYRAVWYADAVAYDLRAVVVERLGDPDGC